MRWGGEGGGAEGDEWWHRKGVGGRVIRCSIEDQLEMNQSAESIEEVRRGGGEYAGTAAEASLHDDLAADRPRLA